MPSGAPRILVIALAIQLVLGGALVFAASQDFELFGLGGDGGAATTATAATRVDRFDERRAWALLDEQVDRYGPRPAGSDASRRLAARLRRLLPRGRYERIPGHPRLRNVVGVVPGRRPAVVIGAHYDTDRNVVGVVPGRRPAVVIGAHYDTEATVPGHVGANDGAAGTAAVVELARALRRARRPAGAPELRFVLFDGEEEPRGCADEDFEQCGLRGSKAYVRAHARTTRAMVLLDYIAEKGARIPREASSDIELWGRLRAAARRAGALRTFPDTTGAGIIDDHTPFLEEGIPAIDLIDFDYRYRDTTQDTPDKLSIRSLDAVGESVAGLLLDWPG